MAATASEPALSEPMQVWWNRYEEARLYGFSVAEARLYASSEIDTGELRRLKDAGCTPDLASSILL